LSACRAVMTASPFQLENLAHVDGRADLARIDLHRKCACTSTKPGVTNLPRTSIS
jgi:hypothetical protein